MENVASHDSFGDLLQALRKRQKGVTQKKVAEVLGVTRQTVCNWERGESYPQSKDEVLTLVRVLRLSDKDARKLLDASLTAPAAHWCVPYQRNPFFTGREEMLDTLHETLTRTRRVAVITWALAGLGGVGKTQLALEYAFRHALDYRAVFWVNAETSETIVSSYSAIAESLALPERQEIDQQELKAAVQRWLNAHGDWLIVWDNLEDVSLVSSLLATAQGTHLITTRQGDLGTLAQEIDVLPLPAEEAVLFLLRRTKRLPEHATSRQLPVHAQQQPKEHEAAKDLVRLLGGLPLALDQAGAYIVQMRCRIATYLKRYRAQRGLLLQERGESEGHPESVSTTFRLALSQLEQAPLATDLLRLCAYLAPDAIPEALLATGVDLGETLTVIATDEFALDDALAPLLRWSLMQRDWETDTLSIHRLVQAVQQGCLDEAEQRQWAERAVRLVAAAFPDSNDFATWDRCRLLLPHAQVCAYHIKRWDFMFPEAAKLLNDAGHYLRQRVRIPEALPLLEHALQIREQTLPPNHLDLATSLNNLAAAYWAKAQYRKALPLFQQALEIREQVLGPDDPDVARSLSNIALQYIALGQPEEAMPRLHRALAICQQKLGPIDPTTATIMHHLADLYVGQARYQEALPHYEQAKAIREQTLGSEHPDLALSLDSLAQMYERQRRHEDALALHKRSLEIREQKLGSNHLDVSYSLSSLAMLYHRLGQDEEALALLNRASKIRERVQGPEHNETAGIHKYIADIYTKQGRYKEAGRTPLTGGRTRNLLTRASAQAFRGARVGQWSSARAPATFRRDPRGGSHFVTEQFQQAP